MFFTRSIKISNDDSTELTLADDVRTNPIRVVPVMPVKTVYEIFISGQAGALTTRASYTDELFSYVQNVIDTRYANGKWKYNSLRRKMRNLSFSLTFKGKVLSQNRILLSEYNMFNRAVVNVEFFFIQGGSKATTLTRSVMELGTLMGMSALLEKQCSPESTDAIMHAVECLHIGYKDFAYVNSKADLLYWCEKMVKMSSRRNFSCMINDVLTGGVKSLDVQTLFDRYFSKLDEGLDELFVQQSLFSFKDESFEDNLSLLRKTLTTAIDIGSHPIVKRFVALTSYLLVHDMLSKIGIDFKWCEYNEMEQQAMRAKYASKKGFVLCVLEVSLFIVERLYQVYKTGQWSVLLHSGSTYEKWLDKAEALKRKSLLLANPEVHGFTIYEFIADLKMAIEEGETIRKFPSVDCKYEMKSVKYALNDLQMIDANTLTKRAARATRDAPLACLVLGKSGIGKSGVMEILFRHYAQYFELPDTDDYRFTRNSMDDYWSGFSSSCWCAVFDDIAAINPSMGIEDKTLNEVLQVINNVPFVTNQADLPDKGRIPFRCELILASTNAPDLNAHHYYQNSAAAQRRFPFVVEVCLKPEFETPDGFIDKVKAVAPEEGELPNYWTFAIKKYVPKMNGDRQMADLRPVLNKDGIPVVYSDIDDFVSAYIRVAEAHKLSQVQSKQAYGVNVSVCRKCARSMKKCNCTIVPQTLETEYQEDAFLAVFPDEQIVPQWYLSVWRQFLDYTIVWFIQYCLHWFGVAFVRYNFIQRSVSYLLCIKLVRYTFWSCIEYFLSPTQSARLIGLTIEHRKVLKNFALFIVGATAIVSTYSLYSCLITTVREEDEIENQGSRVSTGKPITVPEPEKENVWHATNYECTTLDLPLASKSLVGKTYAELSDMLAANVVYIVLSKEGNGFYSQMALCLKGQKYIINAHAFPEFENGKRIEKYAIRVNVGILQAGVSQIVSVELRRSDIYFDMKHDLAMFEILGASPKKDITKFIPSTSFTGVNDGFYLMKNSEGRRYIKNLAVIMKTWSPPNCNQTDCTVYTSTCPEKTDFGECGAMLIINAPRGPVIGGFHAYAKLDENKQVTTTALAIAIDSELIAELEKKFSEIGIDLGDIEPGPIALDLNEGDRNVGPIHHKSVVNFCEKGTANVYGTISGVRPKPRSKVCSTVLREVVEQKFEKVSTFGAPVMEGWNCWRKNFLPVVDRESTYNKTILQKAVNSFVTDILSELDSNDPHWRENVHPLDDYSTVNGINGVQFIDAMNFNTSMGNPWCTTKKKFVVSAPTEQKADGKDFDAAVWERVTKCHESYLAGQRYMPVFQMHLKDEAVPFQKILDEKTRGFSSGPVDYSIETRKYLLPFVRLVQKNKFIFESGPGTVCQSAQWEQIRDYLVTFGCDKIIAGDYKQFDKGMSADFILMAYSVIRSICREAGYTDEDLKVITGIAYDTAFPVTNFNGDLIEFFGSNPSGHPLTVIINGIVNALYMRYAFCMLNPNQSCNEFKSVVHLMTYGDDNIMGVSDKAPWFNHSEIARIMKTIGVTYTTSDKSDRKITYVHIDDEQFLKRKWRFDEKVGFYMCPLDEESIFKSLTVWVPSGSVSPGFQMMSVVQSALYEYFYYGEEKFTEMRNFLMEACYNDETLVHYIQDSSFPTWEMLLDGFMRASHGLTTARHGLIEYVKIA